MGSSKDEWTTEDFIERYTKVNRDELVGEIAHDIRNQLATIVGYLELMNYDFKQSRLTDEDKQQFIQTMIARAHTIQVMLDASISVVKNYPQ